MSFAEYALAGRQERSRDKDTRWFIPAIFSRPERRADAVSVLSGFTLDFDDGAITGKDIGRLKCRYVAWSSYSHGVDGKEKWRVFIPYAEPITPTEHINVYTHFQEVFGGHLDPRCKTISQLWYLPGHPRDAPAHEVLSLVDGPYFVLPDVAQHPGNASSGGMAGQPPKRLVATGVAANSELSASGPASLRDIESALGSIDPATFSQDYTDWLNLAMAVYDGTKGSREGYDIFDAWSRRIPGYEQEGIEISKWESFGGRHGDRITVATLFKQAQKAGWSGAVDNTDSGATADISVPETGVSRPEPAACPQSSPAPSQQPVQLVLPLTMTAPVPMPAEWRNHPKEYAIQKQAVIQDGSGNKEWKTVIRGTHLIRLEYLASVGEEQYSVELHCQNASRAPTVTCKGGALTDTKSFRELLGDNGIITSTANEFKEFQEMIMDWLKQIQQARQVKQSFTHLGWMEKEGQLLGFAHGDSAYFPDGTVTRGIKVSSSGGATISKHYYPAGDLTTWKSITHFLTSQGRPELMAILATAFGSPLMKFSGHSGAVVSIVSTASGVGKSTALSMAQSVWGSPKSAIHAANDTAASLSSKMGFTKDLPAYWDDIKGEKTFQQFAETIYQVTQGKEKSRLSQQANLREVETWNCLAVVAANDSIIEIVKRYGRGTDAGAARIFEIRLEQRPPMTQQATFFDQCTTNYGRAGEVYAAWLAQNSVKARQLVEALSDKLGKELQTEAEERFWLAAIVTMIAGAMIAKQLQLVDFDVSALAAFLKQRYIELRGGKVEMVQEQGPENLVADLIYDHQATTLRIKAIPRNNKVTTQVLRAPKLGTVDIIVVDDDATVRIRKAKFNAWCQTKQISPDTLKKRLEKAGAITERNADPMAATPSYSQGSRTTCYDIDLRKLKINGDPDEVRSGESVSRDAAGDE
jgi:Domain of unknown function (DUF927)/Primase C terminal 2 (PriCT-2)